MRSRLSATLVVGLAFVLSACTPSFVDLLTPRSPHPHQALLDQFEGNVALWTASGITRYAFTYEPSCFCPSTSHLVVVDGDAVRVDGVAVDPTEPLHDQIPAGVAGLFALVRRAIDGDHLTVTYDPATGVPVAMTSDPGENA